MVWANGQELQGGKYMIEEVLGQGGFGITYKALHVSLNNSVVIKTQNEYLRHDGDYEKYVDQFIKEGHILARLSEDPHPYIVGVRDLFQEGETHCLVMDFIPGENLSQLVKRKGAILEAEAVGYIRQIGEALKVVHEAGLVHRDAHPGNIIIRNNSKAVLIDFGIAKELIPSTQTSTGKAGNQGFAPYEQMYRGSREPNVDVYCLAATLYYIVTGERPATGLQRKLDNTPLIPPKDIVSGISDRVNRAIIKGMALEPRNRPKSMQNWLDLLEVSQVVTPPPVNPLPGREVIRPSFPESPAQPSRNSDTGKTRTIPWVSLVLVLVSYLLIGITLVWAEAGAVAWVVPVAGAVAGAVAVDWAWAFTKAGAWAVAIAGAWAVGVAIAGAWAVAWAVAVAIAEVLVWAVAMAWARNKLFESFSRFHTFLILLGTSWLGLGLGWLVYLAFSQTFSR